MFEAPLDACAETACPRCGRIVPVTAAVRSERHNPSSGGFDAHDDIPHFLSADGSHGGSFSLSGQPGILRWTKNVAVRLVNSVCPNCGHKVGRAMPACPHCGHVLRKNSAPVSGEFGRVLRKMLIAATVFIGFPAGVIVFVLVVCAPKGGDVGFNAPRPAPASPGGPSVTPQKANANADAPHRTALSVLRAIRDRLRGSDHGPSSVPAKPSLEKTGDGVRDAHVPPMGTRDGQQVKPDPAR